MSLAKADLERIVAVAVRPQATVQSHELRPYSESRHGIMGDHYTLVIHTGGPSISDIHTLQFFAKFPTSDKVLKERIVDSGLFAEEANFFRRVLPLLRHTYRGPAWCPLHYLAKSTALVQEDLRTQGYAMREQSLFDEPTLKSVLCTLAKFHASTLLAQSTNVDNFNRTHSDMFKEKVFTDVGKAGRANELGFETMKLLAERFGLDGSIIPEIMKTTRELVKPVEGRCNVICHGDLWRTNLLFKTEEDKSLRCMLVDFQMLRYASPTIDVAMVLYVHASPEIRERSDEDLLRYYYGVLRDTLTMQQMADPLVPTFDEIWRDYFKHRIIGMAYSAQRWPAAVINNRHDVDALERWYLQERFNTYSKLMDEDPELEQTMKGYLKELIDEGRRLLD